VSDPQGNISVSRLPNTANSSHLPSKALFSAFLVVFTCIAYANSFAGVFVFDDIIRIVEEDRIRRVWPLGALLSGERPVVDLSLAVNYTIGGLRPWGYHAFNLAVHILAGLTLFGVVRRTIELWQRGGSASRRSPTANWDSFIAFAVAMIFLVHPLQTQSVTYVIQRGESMMGLLYLLTLYGAIRAMDSQRRRLWYVGAVLACALGMGTKAVMVTAPIMVVLYDWVFLARGDDAKAKQAFQKQRLPLYVGLMATWSVLWLCGIASETLGNTSTTSHVGFSYKGISALQYAATQPGVICKYLQLALWPASQCIDYDWPVAAAWQQIVPPAVCVGILLAVTAWLFYRRHWLGFAGAWFFLILAPTSSFVPIKDVMFEHRMYLPLAAVISVIIVPLGFALAHVFGSAEYVMETRTGSPATGSHTDNRSGKPAYGTLIPIVVIIALAAPLSYATHLRNRVYQRELALWQDVVAKRPGNARAYVGVGVEALEAGDSENAILWFRKALALKDAYADAHYDLAIALAAADRHNEAISEYLRTVQLNPARADAWMNAARSHSKLGNFAVAADAIRAALRLKPEEAEYHYQLANALADGGDLEAAAISFLATLRLDPNHASAHINLGNIYLQQQLLKDAETQYEQALRSEPNNAVALVNLGRTLLLQKQWEAALALFRKIPADNPLAAKAKFGAAQALAQTNRIEEAKSELREVLRLDPGYDTAAAELARLEAGG
jgi:tetratricopeptide (TPR) repeat protein